MYMIGRVSRYLNADHGLSKVRRAPHPSEPRENPRSSAGVYCNAPRCGRPQLQIRQNFRSKLKTQNPKL